MSHLYLTPGDCFATGSVWRLMPVLGVLPIMAYIKLFRERLSEKVHVTIPKGIVGGFGFTVLQRNLKELPGTKGHENVFVSANRKQQK